MKTYDEGDVCYYCGEPMDDEDVCTENPDGPDRPHESQNEVNEIMNTISQMREDRLNQLARDVDGMSDGIKL